MRSGPLPSGRVRPTNMFVSSFLIMPTDLQMSEYGSIRVP
ncbi:hypothetical protein MMALV_05550 [Candidatus Methanomethylophilus alvi Mx1201]|uniref:Uncharacterized protein n=1 Tax=Methanomethylophilus alvi (strain Mx1201) TaxID=1236689 RepID=M9SAC1_METAX|nr:hypothetical protein MMALV_05550 [Candidatus Methanomethylophilus alvi Mx1201]